MTVETTITLELDDDLAREVEDAVEIFQKRDPGYHWDRQRVILLALRQGMKHIFRQSPRDRIGLNGVYRKLVPEDTKGESVFIEDISKAGVKFRTTTPNIFRTNEVIEIEFALDDPDQTLINRKVMITHITGSLIGAEFCDTDDFYHRLSSEALEAYLASRMQPTAASAAMKVNE